VTSSAGLAGDWLKKGVLFQGKREKARPLPLFFKERGVGKEGGGKCCCGGPGERKLRENKQKANRGHNFEKSFPKGLTLRTVANRQGREGLAPILLSTVLWGRRVGMHKTLCIWRKGGGLAGGYHQKRRTEVGGDDKRVPSPKTGGVKVSRVREALTKEDKRRGGGGKK